eukprot:s2453_g1.t1
MEIYLQEIAGSTCLPGLRTAQKQKIFAITAGYLFGFPAGFLLAITAGGVSGCICFLLSRIMRPSIARLISHNQAYGRINRAVELEGFKIIFLLRLSPVVPFSILSYACGLSQVAFPAFCLANILGFMPCTAALVWAATHMRSVMESGGVLPVPVYIGAAVVTAALLYLATMVAKNALDAADRHAAEKSGNPWNPNVNTSARESPLQQVWAHGGHWMRVCALRARRGWCSGCAGCSRCICEPLVWAVTDGSGLGGAIVVVFVNGDFAGLPLWRDC